MRTSSPAITPITSHHASVKSIFIMTSHYVNILPTSSNFPWNCKLSHFISWVNIIHPFPCSLTTYTFPCTILKFIVTLSPFSIYHLCNSISWHVLPSCKNLNCLVWIPATFFCGILGNSLLFGHDLVIFHYNGFQRNFQVSQPFSNCLTKATCITKFVSQIKVIM